MTTQHTTGPWNVTGLYVREQDGGLVASINDLWHDQKTPKAEKNANARLIAAAPELLAALQALTITARTFRNVPKEDQYWTICDDDSLDAAFAAIARATATP